MHHILMAFDARTLSDLLVAWLDLYRIVKILQSKCN